MARRTWGGGTAPKKTPQLKSWSYSTWNTWRKCPRRIFFAKIQRLPDPMGKAAQRGIKIHEIAEEFIKGKIDKLPVTGTGKELRDFGKDFIRLRESATAKSELDLTFTRTWGQTHWRDWDHAWVRIKVDAFDRPDPETIVIVDFKTGQRRDYDKQLELYGLGGMKAFPKVKKVIGEIWYLDEGKSNDPIEAIEFTKKEEPALQKLWEERVKPMMADTTFRAQPSSECSWCPFSKGKGGPCVDG